MACEPCESGSDNVAPALIRRWAQADFDNALNQGVACAAENVAMRMQINEQQMRRVKAQSEMRSKIMAGGLHQPMHVCSAQGCSERWTFDVGKSLPWQV